MTTAERENSKALAQVIIERGKPDVEDTTLPMPFKLNSLAIKRHHVQDIVDEIVGIGCKSVQASVIELHQRNVQQLLCSAIAAAFQFKWLSISTRTQNLKSGTMLGNMGFDRRRLETYLPILEKQGWLIKGRVGFKAPNPKDSRPAQYFAAPKLIEHFADCLYDFEDESFDLDTRHRFNKFPAGTVPDAATYEKNEGILRRYNAFMRDHSWAKKGPTTRVFSENIERAGRLNNGYQNIVNRRVPVRKSTLLDGCAIAEPDFSCNHLRMASALVGEELPADPYTAIIEAAGGNPKKDRPIAKAVITTCMGATSLSQKGGIIGKAARQGRNKLVIPSEMFNALLEASERLYPWIKTEKLFFNDVGATMQKIEGDIGLKMVEWATDEGIPLISVHDAYAVKKEHELITEDKMNAEWKKTIKASKR